jgi:hypothetical protein
VPLEIPSAMADPKVEPAQEDGESHVCVDCGRVSPRTQTGYTLISSLHGWRLTRGVDHNGDMCLAWHCPTCWAKQRSRKE